MKKIKLQEKKKRKKKKKKAHEEKSVAYRIGKIWKDQIYVHG